MERRFIARVLAFIAVGMTLFAFDSAAGSLKPIAEYERDENIRLGKQIAEQLPSNSHALQKLKGAIKDLEESTVSTSRTSAQGAELSPRIVNGVRTFSYPAVGALLRKQSGIFRAKCTGTMITCDAFLTAAHCIAEDLDEKNYKVYLQNGGIFEVKKITYQPEIYDRPTADVAVLKLRKPVNGIAPAPINNFAQILPPAPGIIVGFGTSGGTKHDQGIKQIGTLQTSSCPSPYSNDTLICWRFEGHVGNPGEDSNTCHGDSGGPLYVKVNHKYLIAGITSKTENPYCDADTLSLDCSVFKYWQFIGQAASLSNTLPKCGSLFPVGTPDKTIVKGASGELGEEVQEATFEVLVPPGAAKLRIGLNGFDSGTNDFDLYVRHGGPASAGRNDCADAGPGQFEFCEFDAPAQGEWNITVQRDKGSGSYQVVATIFKR
jgi:hypothetical protein